MCENKRKVGLPEMRKGGLFMMISGFCPRIKGSESDMLSLCFVRTPLTIAKT